MRKQNILLRFIKKVMSIFIPKEDEATRKKKSDDAKREMCHSAVLGGVCPNDCERCAWHVE